jgi:ankyrin repeat protein
MVPIDPILDIPLNDCATHTTHIMICIPHHARPDLFSGVVAGTSALHAACFAGSWKVVEALLDMGLDPNVKLHSTGFDAMYYASFHNRTDLIEKWVERFPDYDVNHLTKNAGGLMLAAVIANMANKETIEALIKAGVDPQYRLENGATILHAMAANPDMDMKTAQCILELPGVRELIDVPMRPLTRKWWLLFKASRLMVRLGTKKKVLRWLAGWEGLTPLGSAARSGNSAAIEVLARDGGADPRLRNAQGLTPLELARRIEGTQYYNPLLATDYN